MEEKKVTFGAVVWLKSGGPAMTVNGEQMDGSLRCTWFVSNELFNGEFFDDALTTERPEKAPASF